MLSFLYDELPNKLKGKQKKSSNKKISKVNEYQMIHIKLMVKEALTEDLIFMISDFFSTKDLIVKMRPLSK